MGKIYRSGGRVGKVTTATSGILAEQINPDMRCFQLIVEGGKTTLGCWLFIGWTDTDGPMDSRVGAIFERVS